MGPSQQCLRADRSLIPKIDHRLEGEFQCVVRERALELALYPPPLGATVPFAGYERDLVAPFDSRLCRGTKVTVQSLNMNPFQFVHL